MRLLFFLLLLADATVAYGQRKKVVSVPTCQNSGKVDTSYYVKYQRNLAHKIRLTDLRYSADAFHFRFWTEYQALDIWTLDSVTYFGAVTSFRQHYNNRLFRRGIREVDSVIFKQQRLSNSDTKRIIRLLDSLAISKMPSDNQIPGWGNGFDGEEFITEISTRNTYTFKSYWTPYIFVDKLPEAKRLQTLVTKLYVNFKFGEYAKKLHLPPGHYQHDGIEGVRIQTLVPADYPGPKISIFDWF